MLFLYFFSYLLHSFPQRWETSKWKSVLGMDVYVGSGTGGYKDESDILHSKCLSSKRGVYQSAFDMLCFCNKWSPSLSGTTKIYSHLCSYHLKISCHVHFILELSLKQQPSSGTCHLHVSGKRRKETGKEKGKRWPLKVVILSHWPKQVMLPSLLGKGHECSSTGKHCIWPQSRVSDPLAVRAANNCKEQCNQAQGDKIYTHNIRYVHSI